MSQQTTPTVGIVGANGQVGTELCFLLRKEGVEVVPIVRNSVGATTFDYYGLNARIADVGTRSDAESALSNLDTVVIAAFASPISRGNFKPKQGRRANEAIVHNSVRAAPEGADVVYFSSVAAFGEELDVSDHWWYCREKRNTEREFEKACDEHQQDGYVYRVGLVLGQNVTRTVDIQSELASSDRVDVEANATAHSNTVHTVTIADAVRACSDPKVKPGTYTLVNEPQWTWQRVFDHYREPEMDVDIRFVGPQTQNEGAVHRKLLSEAAGLVAGHKTELMSAGFFLPDSINQFIFNKYMQNDIGGEIDAYESRFAFHKREFDYAEAPGPTVPGLSPTEARLEETDYPPEVFR